jgi:phage shock protein E
MKLKAFIIAQRWIITGGLVGAVSGYLYWYFIGCQDGYCTIKSSPVNMTLYGALMGGLVFDLFHGFYQKSKTKKS